MPQLDLENLAEQIQKPDKSVHRMLSNTGNPTMGNLSAIFAAVQKTLNVDIHTKTVRHTQ